MERHVPNAAGLFVLPVQILVRLARKSSATTVEFFVGTVESLFVKSVKFIVLRAARFFV